MRKHKTKALSLLLAVLMLITVIVPAFAEDETITISFGTNANLLNQPESKTISKGDSLGYKNFPGYEATNNRVFLSWVERIEGNQFGEVDFLPTTEFNKDTELVPRNLTSRDDTYQITFKNVDGQNTDWTYYVLKNDQDSIKKKIPTTEENQTDGDWVSNGKPLEEILKNNVSSDLAFTWEYKITLHKADGSTEDVYTVDQKIDTSLLPQLDSGYVWSSESGSIKDLPTGKVSSDLDLYAVQTPEEPEPDPSESPDPDPTNSPDPEEPKNVTVTLDYNIPDGVTAPENLPKDTTGTFGGDNIDFLPYSEIAIEIDGYVFLGWQISFDGKVFGDGDELFGEGDLTQGISYFSGMTDGPATAKAQWEKIDENAEYKVTFSGGSGATGEAPQEQTHKYQEKFTLPANTFSKANSTFNGWSDGSKTYPAGYEYEMPAHDVTFTAQWKANQSGGSTGGSTGGGTYVPPSTPSYRVDAPASTENGSVALSANSAKKDAAVTITVVPDPGYRLPKYSDGVTVTDASGNSVAVSQVDEGRYSFTMPGSAVSVNVAFVPEMPFLDVSPGTWYADAVEWGFELNYFKGLTETAFGPDVACKRAEIVTFLWRAAGEPKLDITTPFTDVADDAWYADAVKWAYATGITKGLTDTTFGPGKLCTRAQALTYLYRYENEPSVSGGDIKFTDVDMSDGSYYKDAVLWAVGEKITEGISDTTFGPNVDCTRGHVVTWMFRDMVD